MPQQSRRPKRPPIDFRFNRKSRERDPYLYLLTAQMSVCAVMVLIGYAISSWYPSIAEAIGTDYRQLIIAREVSFSEPGWMAQVAEGYVQVKDDTLDTVAVWVTQLLTPIKAEDQQAESSAASEEQALTGAGGWMGVGTSAGRTPPTTCDFSPVTLSAWLEPPISGRVTSAFGYRTHPLTETDDFHRGIDIAAAEGTGIYTPLPGQVIEVDESAIYGKYITIDHGRGLLTTYCHCSAIIANLGENLRKGELIATVGNTGISTGPHVHFEISKNGKYYNPAWVVEGMSGDGD